jgi:hypothetical protein
MMYPGMLCLPRPPPSSLSPTLCILPYAACYVLLLLDTGLLRYAGYSLFAYHHSALNIRLCVYNNPTGRSKHRCFVCHAAYLWLHITYENVSSQI